MEKIPGLGIIPEKYSGDFRELQSGGEGTFAVGKEGVLRILTPKDNKAEFIIYPAKTLVFVKSQLGYPAIYPLQEAKFQAPARALLMDLDGTSVKSEFFWIWIIEQVTARLLGKQAFTLEADDEPHVSGHSVSEHLEHCVRKYCPDKSLEEARKLYFEIAHFEMEEILQGRGRTDAFTPSEGLKEFLLTLKDNKVKIGLVTSGLYEKAWPEILSAFKTLDMGDPLDFYDAIITAGHALKKGQTGTLGELAPKPHPWLYAETARVGLELSPDNRNRVIGMEDSSAGVLSIRLAGFAAIGISGGNIERSGIRPLLYKSCENLMEALPVILGN